MPTTPEPTPPARRILTLNGGSSSIKFALFDSATEPVLRLAGVIERIGQPDSRLKITRSGRPSEEMSIGTSDRAGAVTVLLDWLEKDGSLVGLMAVGHRIVHGGPNHFEPEIVTPELLADLEKAIPFAPNHLPGEIALIEAIAAKLPKVPQIVCFDTLFHTHLPDAAAYLPIPTKYEKAGVRRYGFHGLSYAYLMTELERQAGKEVARGKVILAHLGSGCSMAAVLDGRCVDTTMGFTPAGGMMMATRSGDLDPGVLVYLMRSEGLDADGVDRLVNRESGLLGMSGISGDLRDIMPQRSKISGAAQAYWMFCHSARKAIASMAAALDGVTTLVFAGGIGEHLPEVRADILEGLSFLGIRTDRVRNQSNDPVISADGSACAVRVIPTDEELTIARHVASFASVDAAPPVDWDTAFSTVQGIREVPDKYLAEMHAYWRAANYLSVGQIYLLDNPLLKEPLKREHIKPRLLGHWGTTPGLNLIYVHLNRLIWTYDLNVLYVAGPGHGGPGIVANVYLEGTYTEVYPEITQDEAGLKKLFRQFSFPGGIGSHCTPETPGSIHEGGELGYSLSHAFGAAFDNPDLLVACVVGDGEAETGPLATAWHSNKFLDPVRDGAVLPILHLNGFKIANPTVLSRIPREELRDLLAGYGYKPYFVEETDARLVHEELAWTFDRAILDIQKIQSDARERGVTTRPVWPMIVLKTPKGWTCPKEIDGLPAEGSWRAHQVPMANMDSEEHVRILETWLKSYKPEELFDETGRLLAHLEELAPVGTKRMGANPHANGGAVLVDLKMPDYRSYAIAVPTPGGAVAAATKVQGSFLRDVMKANAGANNFRVFSPDELASNRWQDVLEVTGRCFTGEIDPADGTREARDGRIMEVLSEHQCQGWLEGYLLTGRHGFFSCYEAFVHIVDSMFNQHAKWLKVSREVAWRKPIASLNYLLSSHVWQQDHNGFSHQDPGFIDHVLNKKAEIVRVYLPPDANCLLSITDHCLRSRNYVNVVVAGKQPSPQWLTMDQASAHCAAGIGIWDWASSEGEPDVVLGCCGDVPTLEVLSAAELLRDHLPDLKVRLVNVVDLMKLQPASEHPHGLTDDAFDALFSRDKPVIFAFHGYPWLIHRLTYRRNNHVNLHVRGYKEEGTTTTPFDMCVLNEIDRFHIVLDVIRRVPGLAAKAEQVAEAMRGRLTDHSAYIRAHGVDMPDIVGWQWGKTGATAEPATGSQTAGDQA